MNYIRKQNIYHINQDPIVHNKIYYFSMSITLIKLNKDNKQRTIILQRVFYVTHVDKKN